MPVPSNYLINFTDPAKTAISVLGGDKNGPGFITQDTSIVLLGQYAPLYGEDINENFLHLLENFSNSSPPNVPIQGQLWYSNDDTYDNRSLSAANVQYQGDFYFRVRTKDALGSEFWALPRSVLVDDNIGNLTSYTPLPGDLWIDTIPNSTNGAKIGVSWIGSSERTWDFPELKIFDADTGKFESIGRNYLKLNDNGSQTITSNIALVGTLSVTGLSALNATTVTTLQASSTVTFTTNVTVGTSLTVGTTLDVTGASTFTDTVLFHNNLTIDNNSTLSSDGACLFDSGTIITNLTVGDLITSDDLQVNVNATVDGSLTVGTNIALDNLDITGGTNIHGDVTIDGIGYGNLTVTGLTSLQSFTSVGGTLTGLLTANVIDMNNTRIVDLSDPSDPQDASNKRYIDNNYLRMNSGLGAGNNEMSAVLVLSNVGQNAAPTNASTVGYVDTQDSLNVKKAGDSIVFLNITDPITSLTVAGSAVFSSTVNIQALTAGPSTFLGNVDFQGDLGWSVPGHNIDLNSGYIRGVTMTSTPLVDDAPNVGYVNTNFSRVNPTTPVTPKNGDIRTTSGVVEIFINTAWTVLQTSAYQVPPGMVQLYAGYTPPAGWLECNGGLLPYVGNEALYAVIGTIYGGDPLISFRLPDLRGQFVRGWSNGGVVDSGRTIGSLQLDALQNITGTFDIRSSNGNPNVTTGAFKLSSLAGAVAAGATNPFGGKFIDFDASLVARTANETRPTNVAMMYIIKT